MTTNLIGARIKALREERKLSQDDLARLFGFKDRQTVSAIETGERRSPPRNCSSPSRSSARRSTISPIRSCSSGRAIFLAANRDVGPESG